MYEIADKDDPDTATVDYDTRDKARHMFRLAAMTEKPIPACRV